MARISVVATIGLVLGGCVHIAGVNEAARPGYAHISVPRLDNGRPSVTVFHVKSSTGLFTRLDIPPNVHEIASFALRPGDHTLEVACLRPNAVDVVDGQWFFDVTVEANQSYLLDCVPSKAEGSAHYDNHFSLTRVEPQEEIKEPPLEIGPWLGCYDVGVGKKDAPMRLGTVRLTDELRPATAGLYEAVVVRSLSHLVSVAWWPVRPTSFHLNLSDGYSGWSGDLEQTPAGLQGWTMWSDDTGRKERGLLLQATKTACDP